MESRPTDKADKPQTPGTEQKQNAESQEGQVNPEQNLVVDPFAYSADAGGASRSAVIFRALLRVKDVNDPLVKRAVAELLPEGELVLPSLKSALRGTHAPSQVVAARIVESMRPEGGAQWIMDAVRRGVAPEASKTLLDSLVTFDRDLIEHLFELADHRTANVRVWSGQLLAATVTAAHEPRIQELAKSRRTETRQLAAQLLGSIDSQSAFDLLLGMAGDTNPTVAFAAAESIARSNRADAKTRLHDRILRTGLGREFGYLAIAVCLREERKGEPIPEDLAGVCIHALKLGDPFLNAAASACLASIGYRSTDVAATAYLEVDVLPSLVFAAGGERFFPDFNSIHGLALRRLALLTDREFGPNGPAWAKWWRENNGRVRANRAGFLLNEADLESLAIDVNDMQNNFTVRGASAEPGNYAIDDDEFLLSAEELISLANELKKTKILDAATLPGIRGQETAKTKPANDAESKFSNEKTGSIKSTAVVSIKLRQKGQRKEIGFVPSAPSAEIQAITDACARLREANIWQKYRNPHAEPDRAAFLQKGRDFYHKESNADARSGKLMIQILESLAFLPKQRRAAAFRDLLTIRNIEKRLSEDRAVQLAAYLADEDASSQAAADLIRIVSSLRTPRTCDALVDAAAGGPRGAMRRHFDSIFDNYGIEQAVRGLDDPRPGVRASAAESIGRRAGATANTALLEKLNDKDDDVKISVLKALALRLDKSVATRVCELIRPDTSPAVTRAALETLGRLRATEAFDTIWAATESSDATVRTAAVTAAGRLGDKRFADYIATHWVRTLRFNANTEERAAARDAIFNIGGQAAKDSLRRCLETGIQETQRDVILALAELGDPAAVPALVNEIDNSVDANVRNAIVILTCVDLFTGLEPGRQYRDWWNANRSVSPADWFADACKKSGCAPDLTVAVLESTNAKNAIPALNEVMLNANEWFLRVRAAQILNSIAGERVGSVDRFTPIDDRRKLASQYLGFYQKTR
ncbi:MAG: HEAT repeat domain-containing protein [Planctomycetota bacterium]